MYGRDPHNTESDYPLIKNVYKRRRVYMYTYSWFMLLNSRNSRNIVIILQLNKQNYHQKRDKYQQNP